MKALHFNGMDWVEMSLEDHAAMILEQYGEIKEEELTKEEEQMKAIKEVLSKLVSPEEAEKLEILTPLNNEKVNPFDVTPSK